MIPNTIHFIFLLKQNFGGVPFQFFHFLAIHTASKVHSPDRIYLHYEYEPTGKWWERAKPLLHLNKIKAPTKIFGNKISNLPHKADVIRLEMLMEYGGIYLDLDVISINSFEPLRKHHTVMGIEHKVGLCNAVIFAEKGSAFISKWYDCYRTFDKDNWNYHSTKLPYEIYKKQPDLLHTEDEYSFFFPMYNDPSQLLLWLPINILNRLKVKVECNDESYLNHMKLGREWQFQKLLKAYCIHLWQQNWYEKHLKSIDPESVLNGTNNFSRLLRTILTKKELKLMTLT